MIVSPQQDAALRAVDAWLRDRNGPQVFRLFGYAGTGKTTLAKILAEHCAGTVLFAAFTGKAALVLKQKGCEGAKTLHSLLYKPVETVEGVTFEINDESAARSASLIVIDEVSMVDEALGRDLLSFGTKILVLGDPAQLPPVSGGGFFTSDEPDVMLTEIHRQARDNPILAMAETVRNGGRLAPGAYGCSRVIAAGVQLDADDVMAADQLLCGTNRARRSNNARFRELRSLPAPYPVVGDRLVCLRNNRKRGLLNGGLWNVTYMSGKRGPAIRMSVRSEDTDTTASVSVRPEFFTGQEASLEWPVRKNSDEFDFGYALTVHKAQGSQWSNVILFDESAAFREHRARWLYTGLTRAADKITVVQ